jgi:hypothetical protein
MSGKRGWDEWASVVAAFGLAAAAWGVHGVAWRMGYAADALGLVGCQFLRAILLVLAACTVATALKAAVAPERPAAGRGLTVLDILVLLTVLPGCVGCYPLWPVVLALLAAPLFLALVSRGKEPAEGRPLGPVVLRLGWVVLLFTLTWYWTTSTTRQALRGLGARIAERGGANRLLVWAAEVTAARRQREKALPILGAATVGWTAAPGQGPYLAAAVLLTPAEEGPRRLAPGEVPGWVDDLLGRFQGVRAADVEDRGDDPCVALRTGGSAYHFRIDVCPSQAPRPSLPWWLGDDAGQPWPGVYLSTEGK